MIKNKEQNRMLDFSATERMVRRIIRKLGNQHLDYTLQISTDSVRPGSVFYTAQIESPDKGVRPLTWVTTTPEELVEQLKKFEKAPELRKQVRLAFHQGQIIACQQTIEAHQERIKELEKPDEPVKEEEESE